MAQGARHRRTAHGVGLSALGLPGAWRRAYGSRHTAHGQRWALGLSEFEVGSWRLEVGSWKLTTSSCRRRLPAARTGAPPVRGKGACSHPSIGFEREDTFFRPRPSGLRASTEGRFHAAHDHALDLCRDPQKRSQAVAESSSAPGMPEARASLDRVHPSAPATPVLRDVQHALAREYGHESWIALKKAVSPSAEPAQHSWRALSVAGYEQLAQDFVLTHDAHDLDALAAAEHPLPAASSRWTMSVQRSGGGSTPTGNGGSGVPKNYLELDEARTLIAQDAGFGSWAALTAAVSSGKRRVPPYAIDPVANRIAPRRRLTDAEWDELIAVMKERRITSLDAGGLMTDAVLARLAALDHVTALNLAGSREVTDDGLLHLARMPQLQELDLSEYRVAS